jgi:hypothetical protein
MRGLVLRIIVKKKEQKEGRPNRQMDRSLAVPMEHLFEQ